MRATHRAATLACAAVLASGATPAATAAGGHSRAAHEQVARAALSRLLAGQPFAGHRLDVSHVVRVSVCFHDACVTKRVRPQPTCDPEAGVCIGTALKAWRVNRFTTIEVELL